MLDKEKILIMTKLALYDKTYGETDGDANSFFRHDYVYWKNFGARMYALLGCAIVIGYYAINRIIVNGEDLFEIDYRMEGLRILLFIVVVLFICSTISSLKATREYSAMQKRIERHLKLTEKLEGKGELPADHESNTSRKRRNR